MSAGARPPLWTCGACGRAFANRDQRHACAPPVALDEHFRGKGEEVRAVYDRFARAVLDVGPATVVPERTRIAFQARMSFAQVTPRRAWLDGHVVLARRLESPRFRKVESLSARNHVHHFRLERPEQVDDEVRAWIREAYDVGEQRHLAR